MALINTNSMYGNCNFSLSFGENWTLPTAIPIYCIQWNLSIKGTPNQGHLSNEDTVCCPNHIELCTNPPLN